MRQVIALDVSLTKDGLDVEDVRVTKTILEFPAPDGTLRRALIADGYLNRCVERAMLQPLVAPSSGPALERFWIEGIAGEAVYDLR